MNQLSRRFVGNCLNIFYSVSTILFICYLAAADKGPFSDLESMIIPDNSTQTLGSAKDDKKDTKKPDKGMKL